MVGSVLEPQSHWVKQGIWMKENQFTRDSKGPSTPKPKKGDAKQTPAPTKPFHSRTMGQSEISEKSKTRGMATAEAQRPLCSNFIMRKAVSMVASVATIIRISSSCKDCTRPKEPNKGAGKTEEETQGQSQGWSPCCNRVIFSELRLDLGKSCKQ